MYPLLLPVFLRSFIALLTQRKHLLFSLLVLEAIVLSLITPLALFFNPKSSMLALIIIFVFAVIEASLGLGILVKIRRYKSNEIVRA